MRRFVVFAAVSLAAFQAAAQSFNVDLNRTSGTGAGVPSSAFAGAAGQPGTWNSITNASSGTTTLVGLNGVATAATFTRGSINNYLSRSNPNITGDYELLLEDVLVLTAPNSTSFSFNNLQAGTYALYSYAGNPTSSFDESIVQVAGTTSMASQYIGGLEDSNAFIPQDTHAIHLVTVPAGGSISITLVADSNITGEAMVAGFQLVKLPGATLRIYVDDSAAAGKLIGTSWTDAFTNLHYALTAATLAGGPNTEVWVAQGFYRPATADRTVSFRIPSGVALYGGFGAFETSLDERTAPWFYITNMSGAINTGSFSDNSYTVVVADNTSADTLIDGFTISRGYNSNSGLYGGKGGGVRLQNGSATFRNCKFISNYATNYGAAVYGDQGSPMFVDCYFYDNEAFAGGAIYHTDPSPLYVYNTEFMSNSAFEGGAIFAENVGAVVAGCFFHGNYAGDSGGALRANSGAAQVAVTNCTFAGNTATQYAGGVYAENGADVTLNNSILWSNNDGFSAAVQDEQYLASGVGSTVNRAYTTVQGASGSAGSDPQFVDGNGADNTWGTVDDSCQLLPTSPCIDAGSNGLVPGDFGDIDLDGDTSEKLPLDIDGNNRRLDDPDTLDTGVGPAPVVDRGAFEFVPECGLTADLDGDLDVDLADLSTLLTNYGVASGATLADGDVTGDGAVDLADLSALLTEFGGTCN